MKKLGTQGFTVAESFFVIVMAVLVLGVGFYVYLHRSELTDSTNKTADSNLADPSGGLKGHDGQLFTLQYPNNWTLVPAADFEIESSDYQQGGNPGQAQVVQGGKIKVFETALQPGESLNNPMLNDSRDTELGYSGRVTRILDVDDTRTVQTEYEINTTPTQKVIATMFYLEGKKLTVYYVGSLDASGPQRAVYDLILKSLDLKY